MSFAQTLLWLQEFWASQTESWLPEAGSICINRESSLVRNIVPVVRKLYRHGPIGKAQPFVTQHGEWGPPIARESDIDWEVYSVALIISDVLVSVVWHVMTRRMLVLLRMRWLSPTFRVSIGYVFGTLRLSLIIYFFRAHPDAVYTYLHMVSFFLHSTLGLVALLFGDGPWAHLRPNESGLFEREHRFNPFQVLPEFMENVKNHAEFSFWGLLQWLVAVLPTGHVSLSSLKPAGNIVDSGLEKFSRMQQQLSEKFRFPTSPRKSKSPVSASSENALGRRANALEKSQRQRREARRYGFGTTNRRRSSAPPRIVTSLAMSVSTSVLATGASVVENNSGDLRPAFYQTGGSDLGTSGSHSGGGSIGTPVPKHRRHGSDLTPSSLGMSPLVLDLGDSSRGKCVPRARLNGSFARIVSDPIEVNGVIMDLPSSTMSNSSDSDTDENDDDYYGAGLGTMGSRDGSSLPLSPGQDDSESSQVVLMGPAQFQLQVSQEKWNASILFWAMPSLHSYFSRPKRAFASKQPRSPLAAARRFRAPIRTGSVVGHLFARRVSFGSRIFTGNLAKLRQDEDGAEYEHELKSTTHDSKIPALLVQNGLVSPPISPIKNDSGKGSFFSSPFTVERRTDESGGGLSHQHHQGQLSPRRARSASAPSAEFIEEAVALSNEKKGDTEQDKSTIQGTNKISKRGSRRSQSSKRDEIFGSFGDLPLSPRERGKKRERHLQSSSTSSRPAVLSAAGTWSALDAFVGRSSGDASDSSDDEDSDEELETHVMRQMGLPCSANMIRGTALLRGDGVLISIHAAVPRIRAVIEVAKRWGKSQSRVKNANSSDFAAMEEASREVLVELIGRKVRTASGTRVLYGYAEYRSFGMTLNTRAKATLLWLLNKLNGDIEEPLLTAYRQKNFIQSGEMF